MTRTFTFLTCGFVHGAYQSQGLNRPELRAPSIKGQFRWWYDALFDDPRGEQRLFGFVASKENFQLGLRGNEASRVIVRVQLVLENGQIVRAEFMPHKGHDGGSKNAIRPGTRYEVSLIPRRGAFTPQEQERLARVLDAWLLLGAVGQRSHRGAGSIWPGDAQLEPESYLARAGTLLAGTKLRCALLDRVYSTETQLRHDAGDFIQAPKLRVTRRGRQVEIAEPWWPFGAAEDRKPSPLKLRAALLSGQLRLVAIWDGRHHTVDNLKTGVEQLVKQKDLGRMLQGGLAALACSGGLTAPSRPAQVGPDSATPEALNKSRVETAPSKMTDPTGRSFLSYCRSRTKEAALLVTAQHLHGIPTWQDIEDLGQGNTQEEIRKQLADPGTANAVLLVTPEVAGSRFITGTEVPAMVHRFRARDGFFFVPVAAGGLNYDGAAAALAGSPLLLDLRNLNVMAAPDPMDYDFAAKLAARVLDARLEALQRAGQPHAPLEVRFSTWLPERAAPDAALVMDWHTEFTDRLAPQSVWEERLLPALRTLHQVAFARDRSRRLIVGGPAHLSAAVALGTAFNHTCGLKVAWRQENRARAPQVWDCYQPSTPFALRLPPVELASITSVDLAVLVGINASLRGIESVVAASPLAPRSFRAIVRIGGQDDQPVDLRTPGEALFVAEQVRARIMSALDECHNQPTTLHLFLACPVGLAFLVGQLLKPAPAAQLYELEMGNRSGPYVPAVRVSP